MSIKTDRGGEGIIKKKALITAVAAAAVLVIGAAGCSEQHIWKGGKFPPFLLFYAIIFC